MNSLCGLPWAARCSTRRAGQRPKRVPPMSEPLNFASCWAIGSSCSRCFGGLKSFYVNRAELPAAREVAAQMLRLAEEQDDLVIQVAAHRANSAARYHLGDLVATRVHLESACCLRFLHERLPTTLYAADFRVQALCFMSITLLGLGYPDQAGASGRDALLHAKELAHPQSLRLALSNACQLFGHRRRRQTKRQNLGATLGKVARPAMARSGQARRGPRAARAGLRLVHRGLRDRRPQGRQGAARRAELTAAGSAGNLSFAGRAR